MPPRRIATSDRGARVPTDGSDEGGSGLWIEGFAQGVRRLNATLVAAAVVARCRRLEIRGLRAASEALLARALRRLPGNRALLERYALCAHNEGRYDEALSRWHTLVAKTGASAFPLVAMAANQRELGQLEEAHATITAARTAYPDDVEVLAETARLADRRQEFGEALVFWQRVVGTKAAPAEWRQRRDRDLVILGRLDEADTAIAQARTDDPEHQGYIGNLVMLRLAQARWSDAEATARAFRDRYPNDPIATELLGQAVHAAALAAVEGGEGLRVPATVERVEDETTRALMLGFESIGQDCEFGMVQRRYGAEPLALLRWNHMTLPNLLAALGARLDGVGDDEHTDLVVSDSGEYYLRDRRYGLVIHTFYYTHQMTADALRPKMLIRVRFLKDRFLRDLADAEKVLVYTMRDPDIEAMRRLHQALRLHGPVPLLCVVSREEAVGLAEPGDIVRIEDDLYVGCLTHFGNRNGEWRIRHDEWVALCSRAQTLARHPSSAPGAGSNAHR